MRLARPKPPGRSLDPAGNFGARGMIATVASRGAAEQDPAYRPAPAELVGPSGPMRGIRDIVPRIFLFGLRQFRGVQSSVAPPCAFGCAEDSHGIRIPVFVNSGG